MISAGHLTQFFIASAVIIVVPGPSVMFAVARGVAWGRAVAVLTVLGNSIGALLLSAIVAVGLGPLIANSKTFSTVLQILGGCYLLWLGLDAMRHREEHAEAMTKRESQRPPRLRVIRQGFMVGVLNPKALVFFVAVFPHFVNRSQGHITVQLLIFGAIFSVMAFCSDGTWGFIAGSAREWLANSPARLVAMRVTGACVMMTLGLLILVSAITSA
ncbi:MAG: LysE family translocator [Acidimicrobiales bacterium]